MEEVARYTVAEVVALFRSIKLRQYCEIIEDEEIDGFMLMDLIKNDNLRDLEMTGVHQARLRKALANLPARDGAAPVAAASPTVPQEAQPVEAAGAVIDVAEERAKVEAETRARLEAEARARTEAEARAKVEAAERAQQEELARQEEASRHADGFRRKKEEARARREAEAEQQALLEAERAQAKEAARVQAVDEALKAAQAERRMAAERNRRLEAEAQRIQEAQEARDERLRKELDTEERRREDRRQEKEERTPPTATASPSEKEVELMSAVRADNEDAVCKLLASRADPRIPDVLGRLPLDEAVNRRSRLIVALLLHTKASATEYARSKMSSISFNGNDLVIDELLTTPLGDMELGSSFLQLHQSEEYVEARKYLMSAKVRLQEAATLHTYHKSTASMQFKAIQDEVRRDPEQERQRREQEEDAFDAWWGNAFG